MPCLSLLVFVVYLSSARSQQPARHHKDSRAAAVAQRDAQKAVSWGGGSLTGHAADVVLEVETQRVASSAHRKAVELQIEEPSARPHYDIVYAIFSGDSEESKEMREELRIIYDGYKGQIEGVGSGGNPYKYSFHYLFLVRRETAPEDGLIEGDIMYVPCEDGYHKIAQKTLRMMALVRHYSFRFLFKGDDDTFACFKLIGSILHRQSEETLKKLYMGVETRCGIDEALPMVGHVLHQPTDRWHDPIFEAHTLGGLNCYPVYMQGALYALSYSLVEYLYEGSEHLIVFTNEDTTVGSWLHGVDRAIVQMGSLGDGSLWKCPCRRVIWAPWNNTQPFHHRCRSVRRLRACSVGHNEVHARQLC